MGGLAVGGLLVGGPMVCGAHRRAPLAVAFEHVLTECGHGGGDAAIGAHGPTHRDGGLGMLGGLRDGSACNSFAVLLPLWGAIGGTCGFGALSSVGEVDALLGAARRVAGGGGHVLLTLACCGRGCVSSGFAPLGGGAGPGRLVLECCCGCAFVFYTVYHVGPRSQNCGAEPRRNKQAPYRSPQPKLWRRTEAK